MKPLNEYYYYYKAVVLWKICDWVAWLYDRDKLGSRLVRLRKECGGLQQKQKTVTWDVMVQSGRGGTIVSRAIWGYIRRFRVGSSAPDGVVHRFGSLEELNLLSLCKPGRLTCINFGSYT